MEKVLTSAKIHNFNLEIFNLWIKLCHFGFQIIALFVDLIAFGMNFTTQIAELIIALTTWFYNTSGDVQLEIENWVLEFFIINLHFDAISVICYSLMPFKVGSGVMRWARTSFFFLAASSPSFLIRSEMEKLRLVYSFKGIVLPYLDSI